MHDVTTGSVYGLTALYVALFVLELVRTRIVVRRVLEREFKGAAFGGLHRPS